MKKLNPMAKLSRPSQTRRLILLVVETSTCLRMHAQYVRTVAARVDNLENRMSRMEARDS